MLESDMASHALLIKVAWGPVILMILSMLGNPRQQRRRPPEYSHQSHEQLNKEKKEHKI